MNQRRMYRQGDVFLVEVVGVPAGAKPVPAEAGRLILARGEATGHHHSLPAQGGVALLEAGDGNRYVQISEGAALEHQEHAPIDLPVGVFQYVPQVEYSPSEIRRVAD